MSFISQTKTKRLLSVHGWSGALLGIVLYVVIFTGTVVVFEDEIETWSRGALVQSDGIGTRVDHHFRTAARQVDRRYYEEVSIFRSNAGHFQFLFHRHEIDETGQFLEPTVRLKVDAVTGEVLERWDGLRPDLPEDTASALRDFWVDLHVQLYLPNPYGAILVGVLGLVMMFAAVSGILIHKHLVRDVFLSPRTNARLVGARDMHVLAGSWGLPFAFVLAFTGAFFSLALTVGIPVMSSVAFDGDRQAMFQTLIGQPEDPDLTQAPLAALDFVVADARARTGADVTSIQITNYDSKGAEILVNMRPAPGRIAPQKLVFDGPTRRFEGVKPRIGQEPSAGASLFDLIGPLHFGDFAGMLSKTVWFGMGLAMAYVTATGMLLWTKRRENQPLWRGLRRWIVVVIWGVPFTMLMSAVFYFIALPAGDPGWWTPFGFFTSAALVLALGLRGAGVETRLRLANALVCMALPILRLLTGGASWSGALLAGIPVIIAVDVLFVLTGLCLLREHRRSARDCALSRTQEAAE